MPEKVRELKDIPVESLKFDPKNPRLPSSVEGSDETTVINWMVSENNIIELMGSIGQKGYFPGEPLLVVPDGNGKYEVIEGNRRLCATKLLLNPQLTTTRPKSVLEVSQNAKEHPASLPAIIYDTKDEILGYLGYRHITGVKEWGPLAKARYLAQLRQTLAENNTAKQLVALARTTGTRANYVARLLVSFALYEQMEEDNFIEVNELNESRIEFSILTTALGYENIAQYVGVIANDPDSIENIKKPKLQDLYEWLFKITAQGQTILGESSNLDKLSLVIEDSQALAYLKSGHSLNDAFTLTQGPDAAFRLALSNANKQLQIARSYSYQIATPEISDVWVTTETFQMALAIKGKLDSMLSNREES